MIVRALLFCSIMSAGTAAAGFAADGWQSPPPAAAGEAAPQLRTAEELDELLGPLALFPDALVALILPAAVNPSDIVLAARYLNSGGSVYQVNGYTWDDSVKSLAHYPEVVAWLDEHLEWTKQVGEAFIAQPADVMSAIQRLRQLARAAGTLVDTPQHHVVVDGQEILIVPAQRDVIYVPTYRSEVVYVRQPVYVAEPYITFGVGFTVGSWLRYDCDWRERRIWYWRSPRRWDHHDWRRPVFPGRPGYVADPDCRIWSPRRRASWPHRDSSRAQVHVDIVRPSPFSGGVRVHASGTRGSSFDRDGDRRGSGDWRGRRDVRTGSPAPDVSEGFVSGRSSDRNGDRGDRSRDSSSDRWTHRDRSDRDGDRSHETGRERSRSVFIRPAQHDPRSGLPQPQPVLIPASARPRSTRVHRTDTPRVEVVPSGDSSPSVPRGSVNRGIAPSSSGPTHVVTPAPIRGQLEIPVYVPRNNSRSSSRGGDEGGGRGRSSSRQAHER